MSMLRDRLDWEEDDDVINLLSTICQAFALKIGFFDRSNTENWFSVLLRS